MSVRKFKGGATRDTSYGKADYSYQNPAVEQAHALYMESHAIQSDGSMRPMNNWWAGIPFIEGFKSLQRHVMDVKAIVGGQTVYKERFVKDGKTHEISHYFQVKLKKIPANWKEVTLEESLHGVHFNTDVCILAKIHEKQAVYNK